MQINKLNKTLSYVNNSSREDYFLKESKTFEEVDGVDVYKWFAPNNLYAESVIRDIRNGTTLSSLLSEDLIYKTGDGFDSSDAKLLNYLDEINFKQTFSNSNDHLTKLGNVFYEVIVNENDELISLSTIQPQKCRLSKDGDKVVISASWTDFNKDKSITLPLYPKFKKQTTKGIVLKRSVYHTKTNAIGFDHYGVNENIHESLLLNEKEHRRNNWQLNQIRNGYKKDFFLVSDYPMTDNEKLEADKAFKNISGDDNAGGIESIVSDGGKLVSASESYEFDFTKDDTSDQIFLKNGFPKSLIGIKSGSAFSVEQVESDYEQYLPKVVSQQKKIIYDLSKIFINHTKFNTKDLAVINTPPSVILQGYMQYMNDEQKNKVIENVFKKYGIK